MDSSVLEMVPSKEKEGTALSAILLIGGTSVGAGMLALPTVTGIAGFIPAMALNVVCWLVMMATGLLFLEATLWMEKGANLLSMAGRLLGPLGKWIGGVSFIFLYYCLLVSYVAGGTPILVHETASFLPLTLSGVGGYLLFSALFGVIVYFGHWVVDRINWLLMMSLIISYFLLIGLGSGEVVPSHLMRQEWGATFAAAPILFCAYGYHNVIPTLTSYLNKNVAKLRLSIIVGTAIPFLVYSFWQWMIIGSIPQQEIIDSAKNGIPITFTLQEITGNRYLSMIGGYFGFFALVTSFLGVSLSVVDFFTDGLKITQFGFKRALLCLIIFLPPALLAAKFPGVFVEALSLAGGIGEAVLNGLFPIAMVWVGRYRLKLQGDLLIPGGKIVLLLLGLFTLLISSIEIHHLVFN